MLATTPYRIIFMSSFICNDFGVPIISRVSGPRRSGLQQTLGEHIVDDVDNAAFLDVDVHGTTPT